MTKMALKLAVKFAAGMLLLSTALPSFAQDSRQTFGREYGVDHWGEQEGLTHPRIKSVLQTHEGYLWLGSSAGLVRFDGVRFTSFNMQTGSLRENVITGLAEDKRGALWIATAGGGVTKYHNGRFVALTSSDGLPDDSIRFLDKARDGSLWMATPSGICRLNDEKITVFGVKHGLPAEPVSALSADSDLGVVVCAGGQSYRLIGERFEPLTEFGNNQDERPSLLTGTRDGSLWMAFENGVLKRWKNGELKVYQREQNVPARPTAIYQDPEGTIWVGATDGLWRFRNERFERLSFPSSRMGQGAVWSITSDNEGSLWVGFESDGLVRLRVSRVRTLTTVDGLPDDSTRAVLWDSKHRLWVGTVGGLVEIENGVTTRYVELSGEPMRSITSLGETADGEIWVAAGGQLLVFKGGKLAPLPAWKRVQDIRVIYRDPHNRMWVGTDDAGLFKIEAGAITHYGVQEGLLCDQIRSVLLDRNDRLWVGTFKGLNRWDNGRFVECRTGGRQPPSRVVGIQETSDGAIWFATRGGLSRFADNKFVNFTADDGLFGTYPYCILEEEPDYLWMSCVQGIFRVSKTDLTRLANGQIKRVGSFSLGIRDGLVSTAFTGGFQPSACKTPDGRLLFCSLKGLVVVDPKNMSRNQLSPPVIIENVVIDDKVQSRGVEAVIPPGMGNVQIDYTGLSFLNPEKVRFRYRLEGFDKEWVEAGTRRLVYYANLPPRSYRFQVLACNDDGVWNTKGDTFSFTLLPHFYQTAWFLVVCSLWLILLVGIYIQLRISRHQRHERELQRRVDEALAKVKVLSGLLPICASCKKVRDDSGYWNQLEAYITRHSSVELSHGICPDCMRKLYPEMADDILSRLSPRQGGNAGLKPPP